MPVPFGHSLMVSSSRGIPILAMGRLAAHRALLCWHKGPETDLLLWLDGSFFGSGFDVGLGFWPEVCRGVSSIQQEKLQQKQRHQEYIYKSLDRSVAMCCCKVQSYLHMGLSCRIDHGRFLYADSVQEISWNIS